MTHGLDTSFLVAVEVACHERHADTRSLANSLRERNDAFDVAPQVLAEFMHVVTDVRRFTTPLPIEHALERAEAWWNGAGVVRLAPDVAAVSWFFDSMKEHALGRKRVLDTLLAGTFHAANITSVLTLNPDDFAVFKEFTCLPLPAQTTASGS